MVKDFVAVGVDGIWNDMNEPAVFKTVSKTMPETNIHRGDEEVGGKQSHAFYHNVYGMFQARSTYEGMLLANENKRPFVLTRAAFIGSHRYAATWTGDNLANWEHLSMSIPMALNLAFYVTLCRAYFCVIFVVSCFAGHEWSVLFWSGYWWVCWRFYAQIVRTVDGSWSYDALRQGAF
jgi:hypothetical protein